MFCWYFGILVFFQVLCLLLLSGLRGLNLGQSEQMGVDQPNPTNCSSMSDSAWPRQTSLQNATG